MPKCGRRLRGEQVFDGFRRKRHQQPDAEEYSVKSNNLLAPPGAGFFMFR
jgi:hypothetical protein